MPRTRFLSRELDAARDRHRPVADARAGPAMGFHPPDGFRHTRDTRSPTDDGLDRAEHEIFIEYHVTERYLEDPCFRRYLEVRRPDLTVRTRRLASATEIRRSGLFDWVRAMGTGDHLFSQRRIADGRSCLGFSMWTSFRGRSFARRDSRLVLLLNTELARLVGRVLFDGTDPVSGLPPRLQKTLERLLVGDSEKQAALALGLSKATVHEYVGLLYRHFGVNSRGELLVACLRRGPIQ